MSCVAALYEWTQRTRAPPPEYSYTPTIHASQTLFDASVAVTIKGVVISFASDGTHSTKKAAKESASHAAIACIKESDSEGVSSESHVIASITLTTELGYVAVLNTLTQKHKLRTPEYADRQTSQTSQSSFSSSVRIWLDSGTELELSDDRTFSSKKEAKNHAALLALQRLQPSDYPPSPPLPSSSEQPSSVPSSSLPQSRKRALTESLREKLLVHARTRRRPTTCADAEREKVEKEEEENPVLVLSEWLRSAGLVEPEYLPQVRGCQCSLKLDLLGVVYGFASTDASTFEEARREVSGKVLSILEEEMDISDDTTGLRSDRSDESIVTLNSFCATC